MEKRSEYIPDYQSWNGLNRELSFVHSPQEILRALLQSKEEGTSIGIQCNALGPELIVTSVENIIFEEGQTLVMLKHYDTTGYILPSYKLNLLEIQGVVPFASQFKNPYLDNIGRDKTWFF